MNSALYATLIGVRLLGDDIDVLTATLWRIVELWAQPESKIKIREKVRYRILDPNA